MNSSSIRCTVAIGPTIPTPLPSNLTEVIREIEVIHRDKERSGFKIEFYAGRQNTTTNTLDYSILQSPQIQMFNRVNILVSFNNGLPQLLMDGVITDIQLQNSDEPGVSKITLMGHDVGIMMDLKEVQRPHPLLPEMLIAQKIIAEYANYQLVPLVIPPPSVNTPNITDWIPRQYETDYAYLNKLAQRFGYVFYVIAGPTPGINTAYWGPPRYTLFPQPALAANMGYGRNVKEIHFQQNALTAVTVSGYVQEKYSGTSMPVQTSNSTNISLSQSANTVTQSQMRALLLEQQPGLSYTEAFARAQGITDESRNRVVVAEGSLDSEKYGNILQARNMVGVQGAGLSNDGLYYVEQVIHTLGSGYYRQQFTLTRDGVGSTVSTVTK
jgi:hypothetical protein